MGWIDLHCHLNSLAKTPEEAVRSAVEEGVVKMVTIGTEPKDHPVVLGFANQFQPHVYCTLGVHPHEAHQYNEQCEKWMLDHLTEARVVAVGEIGLDFYYNHSPRDVQVSVFKRQLQLAKDLSLPVQIHTRDAEVETIEVLKAFDGKIQGVLHCFTGTQWLADEALKLNLNISISGVVTFKNADPLREVVRSLPLDRIHVETDAPFLTPVPLRGQKNEPSFVVHTAEYVAKLKRVGLEEFKKITYENTIRVFTKLKE